MHMNHIKLIDLFMLKLCNLNGWKIVMQLNDIKCKFRPNHFFECADSDLPCTSWSQVSLNGVFLFMLIFRSPTAQFI